MSSHDSIWQKARKMMVVIEFKSLDEIKDYREAIKNIGLNINDCLVLAIVQDKKEKAVLTEIHSVNYLSPKDISLLGRLKDDTVNKTLNQQFDIVVMIGELNKKVKKYINRRVKSFFVGVNTGQNDCPLELKTEDGKPDQMIKFVHNTLQKIS